PSGPYDWIVEHPHPPPSPLPERVPPDLREHNLDCRGLHPLGERPRLPQSVREEQRELGTHHRGGIPTRCPHHRDGRMAHRAWTLHRVPRVRVLPVRIRTGRDTEPAASEALRWRPS